MPRASGSWLAPPGASHRAPRWPFSVPEMGSDFAFWTVQAPRRAGETDCPYGEVRTQGGPCYTGVHFQGGVDYGRHDRHDGARDVTGRAEDLLRDPGLPGLSADARMRGGRRPAQGAGRGARGSPGTDRDQPEVL